MVMFEAEQKQIPQVISFILTSFHFLLLPIDSMEMWCEAEQKRIAPSIHISFHFLLLPIDSMEMLCEAEQK